MDELRTITRQQAATNIKRLAKRSDYFAELFAPFLATREYNMLLWYSIPPDGQTELRPVPNCIHLMVHPSHLPEFCESFQHYQDMGVMSGGRLMVNEFAPRKFPLFMDVDRLQAGPSHDLALQYFVETLVEHVPALAPYTFHIWTRDLGDGLYKLHVHVPDYLTTARKAKRMFRELEFAEFDLAVYRPPQLRSPFSYKLTPGDTTVGEAYSDLTCWVFSLDSGHAVAVDPPPPENQMLYSMLNFRKPPTNSGESDWYEDSLEEVRLRVRNPAGTPADPAIYVTDWWNDRLLTSEGVYGVVAEVARDRGFEPEATWSEEAFEAAQERVLEYMNDFCWYVGGSSPGIFFRGASSVYNSISFEGGTLRVNVPQGNFPVGPVKPTEWRSCHFNYLNTTFHVEEETGKYDNQGNPITRVKKRVVDWGKVWAQSSRSVFSRGCLRVGAVVPEGYFNSFRGAGLYMWQGWDFVNANPAFAIEAIDLFRNFLREVICCDPDEPEDSSFNEYSYFVMLHFIMNEVHNTSTKFEWIIYLYSKVQGVGKGRLGQILTLMVGVHNVFTTVNLDAVLGKWGDSSEKNLIIYDEVDANAYQVNEWRKMWSKFKNRATEKSGTFERKGRDFAPVNLQDSHLVFSNCTFPCDSEERRLFITKVNDCRKGDSEYWANWNDVLIEREGWKAVFFWLGTLRGSPNFTTNDPPHEGVTKSRFILEGEVSLISLFNDWIQNGCDLSLREDREISDFTGHREQVNNVFWSIHNGPGARSCENGWRRIFSLEQIWFRVKQDNPAILKTQLKNQLDEFFTGVPGYRIHNQCIVSEDDPQCMDRGVFVDGKKVQKTYIQIPEREVVKELVDSRIGDRRPIPDIAIPDEDFYRVWFQRLGIS